MRPGCCAGWNAIRRVGRYQEAGQLFASRPFRHARPLLPGLDRSECGAQVQGRSIEESQSRLIMPLLNESIRPCLICATVAVSLNTTQA